jgi:ribosomal-protein-alanine N-acetyltransferase
MTDSANSGWTGTDTQKLRGQLSTAARPTAAETRQIVGNRIQLLEALCFAVPWTHPQIAASLDSPDFRAVFVSDNGSVQEYPASAARPFRPDWKIFAGYALFQSIASESTLEILRLGISPQYRRQGLASIVLDHLDSINANFWQNGYYLLLEVHEENVPALRLYETHGFKILDRRRRYYRNEDGSSSDGIILRKTILNRV